MEIKPFIGFDDIQFGQALIQSKLGSPDKKRRNK